MMNFSNISRTSLFGKILRIPLDVIPNHAVLPILMGKIKGYRWIRGSGIHGYWLGSYEYEKQRVFEKHISKGSIVFDIGAHVGFYTLLASALVGPEGRVFAFEPLPRNLFFLKEHMRINQIENAHVLDIAVSDRSGTIPFKEGSDSSMGKITQDQDGQMLIHTSSIDEMIDQGILPFPDYIKIDVEGAEYQVLLGAKTMLTQSKPTLFLATHGVEVHQRCCSFLRTLGYTLSPIIGTNVDTTNELLCWTE